jgi:hypothetical protein
VKELVPLAVAFTVLLGLVAWHEGTSHSSRGLVEEAGLKALAIREFTPDDAAKIEVAAPGATAPAYTLEKKDKSWRVTSSFVAPASGGNVTKLLDALAKAEGEFRSDDKAALEQFDLSPQRSVGVRVLDKDGKELVHVAVGRTSGPHGAFVRNLAESDDPRAYSLTSDLRGLLGLARTTTGEREADKPDAGYFHEKEFPQLKITAAKHAEFLSPGRSVAFDLAKKDDKDKTGEWKVASGGPGVPLKKDGLERAIATLGGGLHPTALVDPAKKSELGFDAPKYRIAVTSDDGTTRAAVGTTDAASEHYYVRLDAAQDPDVVYEANEYEFHQMFPQAQVLFDLPKLDVPKDGPTRLIVEKKGRDAIEMTRKGTKPTFDWTLVSPAWPLDAKQTALRGLGSSLAGVRVLDYVDATELGDAEITVRFGAAGAPDAELATLAVGGKAPAGKERLATLPGRPGHVFVIGENTLDRLAPEPMSLFETKVLHGWQKDDVTSVHVLDRGGLALTRDGEDWSFTDEATAKTAAPKAAVDNCLDRLLAANVTGLLTTVKTADLAVTKVSVERKDGTPAKIGFAVTKDGQHVVVFGDAVFSLEGKDDLVPQISSFVEPPAPAPAPKDEKPPEPAKDEKK